MELPLGVQPGCLQAAPETPSHVSTMSSYFQTTPVAVLIQRRGALSTQYLGTEGARLLALPPGGPGRGGSGEQATQIVPFFPQICTL